MAGIQPEPSSRIVVPSIRSCSSAMLMPARQSCEYTVLPAFVTVRAPVSESATHWVVVPVERNPVVDVLGRVEDELPGVGGAVPERGKVGVHDLPVETGTDVRQQALAVEPERVDGDRTSAGEDSRSGTCAANSRAKEDQKHISWCTRSRSYRPLNSSHLVSHSS